LSIALFVSDLFSVASGPAWTADYVEFLTPRWRASMQVRDVRSSVSPLLMLFPRH
jgi:hypothetical protein